MATTGVKLAESRTRSDAGTAWLWLTGPLAVLAVVAAGSEIYQDQMDRRA